MNELIELLEEHKQHSWTIELDPTVDGAIEVNLLRGGQYWGDCSSIHGAAEGRSLAETLNEAARELRRNLEANDG